MEVKNTGCGENGRLGSGLPGQHRYHHKSWQPTISTRSWVSLRSSVLQFQWVHDSFSINSASSTYYCASLCSRYWCSHSRVCAHMCSNSIMLILLFCIDMEHGILVCRKYCPLGPNNPAFYFMIYLLSISTVYSTHNVTVSLL